MLDPNRSIADLVSEHAECAAVLRRHRIDFCFGGGRSLARACEEHSVDLDELTHALEHAIRSRGPVPADPRGLSTAALIAHIERTHHAYLRQALPFLDRLAANVARVHGATQGNLREIAAEVALLRLALELRLEREETQLFPALESGRAKDAAAELATVLDEQHVVGAALRRLRDLTCHYEAPQGACRSYQTLFAGLAALETGILAHVHLEKTVLAPRFLEAS